MIKKIAKLATSILLGVVLTMGVKESVKAEIIYTPMYGVIYGIDTETGFYAEIPNGAIIPAGAFGNCTNVIVSYDNGIKFTPTLSPVITAEAYLNAEFFKHQIAFQAKYNPMALSAQAYQVPNIQIPNVQVPNLQVPTWNIPTFDWTSIYGYNPYLWWSCCQN